MANGSVAVDLVGRPTSDKARAILDAKGQHPTNHATNGKIAKKAATYVSDVIGRIELSRASLLDRLTVFYGLWNGETTADYFPTARPVHSPEPYKAVEGFVPRAANLLVEQPGWFRAVGIDDAGKRNAEIITKLLLAQLKRDNFQTKFRLFLRDCAIYGFCPGKTRWKPRRRKIKFNEVSSTQSPNPNQPGEVHKLKRGKETEIIEDGPTLEHVDVMDFGTDLRFHDIQESPGIYFRQLRFESDLLAMKDAGIYANVDRLIKPETHEDPAQTLEGPPGTATNPATLQDIRNMSDGISMNFHQERSGYRLYEIYEYWGKFDHNFDEKTGARGREKEWVITLGRKASETRTKGGWVPLRISENPYWHGQRPCVVAHYTRRSHAFHSVGIIEPIVKLSAELDDSRNMALAARALAAKPMFYATDDVDIYSNNLIADPGGVIRGRAEGALRAIHVPDVSDAAYKAEQVIREDIRETTGIISTYQGTSDAASETATSVVSRTREANKRITEVCKNIAEGFLTPMLEQWMAMNQQMITKERMVELIGEDGLTVDIRKISPEEIAGRVQFEITTLPEIEIAGLRARMIDAFLDRAANFLAIDPTIVRPAELLKMSWQAQFGNANINRIFPSADAPLKFRSAMDEHVMFGMGHRPDVQEGENYYEHFKAHTEFIGSGAFRQWPEDPKRALLAHIKMTQARLMAEMESGAPRIPMPMPGTPPGEQMQPESRQPAGRMQASVPQAGGPQGGGPPRAPGATLGPVTTTGQVRSAATSNAPRTPRDGGEA